MRGTAILVAAALALGAYVWWFEIRGAEQREAAERAEKRFLGIEQEEVSALDVPLEDGGSARLVREGESWRLVAPLATPADPDTARNLVRTLVELEAREELPEPGEDLALYGLGEERSEVLVEREEGEPLTVAFGKETPIGSNVYAKLEGGTAVYLVEKFRRDTLHPELKRLRDKRISNLAWEDVTRFRVFSSGRLLVRAERAPAPEEGGDPEDSGEDGEAKWQITEPLVDRGDPSRIRRFLQDLEFARADDFIDEPGAPGEYGLHLPEVELELVADEASERLAIGRLDDEVFAAREGAGVVWEVPERTLDQIPRELFEYRHKLVLELPRDGVHQLEIHFPRDRTSYSFVREGEDWRPADPELGVKAETVEDLLFAIERIEATGIEDAPDEEALGLDLPLVRVVALDEVGVELGWLELADPEAGKGTPAVSSQSERAWRVVNDIGEDVPFGEEAFRNRWLESDAPADEQDDESAQDLD